MKHLLLRSFMLRCGLYCTHVLYDYCMPLLYDYCILCFVFGVSLTCSPLKLYWTCMDALEALDRDRKLAVLREMQVGATLGHCQIFPFGRAWHRSNKIQVVGMTTTAVSKYQLLLKDCGSHVDLHHDFFLGGFQVKNIQPLCSLITCFASVKSWAEASTYIQELRPEIVIVEEAAEVLEVKGPQRSPEHQEGLEEFSIASKQGEFCTHIRTNRVFFAPGRRLWDTCCGLPLLFIRQYQIYHLSEGITGTGISIVERAKHYQKSLMTWRHRPSINIFVAEDLWRLSPRMYLICINVVFVEQQQSNIKFAQSRRSAPRWHLGASRPPELGNPRECIWGLQPDCEVWCGTSTWLHGEHWI